VDTVEFYRDVLGVEPVEFGGGRTVLNFGRSKINLFQVGTSSNPRPCTPSRAAWRYRCGRITLRKSGVWRRRYLAQTPSDVARVCSGRRTRRGCCGRGLQGLSRVLPPGRQHTTHL
jgi:catechol 2,3-dioxygenase-like lactoylglutathione lyase family enzyme